MIPRQDLLLLAIEEKALDGHLSARSVFTVATFQEASARCPFPFTAIMAPVVFAFDDACHQGHGHPQR